jgi:hypothetical protein
MALVNAGRSRLLEVPRRTQVTLRISISGELPKEITEQRALSSRHLLELLVTLNKYAHPYLF